LEETTRHCMEDKFADIEKLILSSWSTLKSEPQISLFKCRLILEKTISVFLESAGAPIEGNVYEQITTLKNSGTVRDDVRRLMRAIQELANMGAHDNWEISNFGKIAETCLMMNNIVLKEAKKLDNFVGIALGREDGNFSRFIECPFCSAQKGKNCRKFSYEGENHKDRIYLAQRVLE